MKILFIASVAVITDDPAKSRKLYMESLGLPLEQHGDTEYYSSEKIEGSRHFGVWPLTEAATACFGQPDWPKDIEVPQSSIEFEVSSEAEVAAAGKELQGNGYTLLHDSRTEPWGQTVARLLSPEGVIIGISYAPWFHKD